MSYFIIKTNLLYELQNLTWFGILKHFLQTICSVVLGLRLGDFATGYQYMHNSVWFLTQYAQLWFFIFEEVLVGDICLSYMKSAQDQLSHLSIAWVPFTEAWLVLQFVALTVVPQVLTFDFHKLDWTQVRVRRKLQRDMISYTLKGHCTSPCYLKDIASEISVLLKL